MAYRQANLMETGTVPTAKEEKRVEVKLGNRAVQYPIERKRRETWEKLKPVLLSLEGKDIFISSYDSGGRHYWSDNLKLAKLGLDFPLGRNDPVPFVFVLRGRRGACVRVLTEFMYELRIQEYSGYTSYLVDFRNGFGESPIDRYKDNYNCLHFNVFNDK